MEKGLQEGLIEPTQFLAQPEVAGHGLLDIKTIGLAGIKRELKAQFDDEQRVTEQKTAELAGVKHPFADAQKEGFEVGSFRVRWPPPS